MKLIIGYILLLPVLAPVSVVAWLCDAVRDAQDDLHNKLEKKKRGK